MQIDSKLKPLHINDEKKATPKSKDTAKNDDNIDTAKEIPPRHLLSAESIKTKPTPLQKLDSLQNPSNTPSHNLNAINTALGELEVMTKSLNTLQKHQKVYEKLALKLDQATEEQDDEAMQAIEQEAQKVYEKMQEAYNLANFGGKNVFEKTYTNLVPEVAISGKKVNPNTLEIKNSDAVMQYASLLKEQKAQVKTARKILYKRAQSEMDELAKTDKSYEKLNRDMLLSEEFKAAQGGRGIRAERVLQLLNLH